MNMLLYARFSEGDVYSHFSWLLWDDSDDGGSECIQCRLGSVRDGDAGRFFNLLLFLDSGRLGKMMGVKVWMKVMVEVVVEVVVKVVVKVV